MACYKAPHVEDDRVQQEGALQPRLVPLRVHEGGVHGPVQKLLVEQDAVDVLEQDAVDVLPLWIDPKNGCFGPGDESAVLIIVLHTSSVLVTVRASKKKRKLIQTGKSLWPFSRNSGVFCGILVIFTEKEGRNKKTRSCNHFGPPW